MNYSGKFDAKISTDGFGLHSPGHVHVETVHATQVPADAIVVEDAHLLFNAQFKRSGVDLVLSKDDSELVLHDYFKGEKRATLASPDGAHLTGDLVNALAGNVQYAQATDGNAGAGKVIGHVSKLAGTATAVRNGVAVILHNGDNVEKGDVVESGASSTLGITFIDGTVFGLSSNARMVLNEMVYDPNGSNNSSLLSLVAGTITFVAGETAKHGDMKVDTPVATMGIRGTAVLCEIDFLVPGQGTPDAKFQVLIEPDGSTGSYILFDKTTLTPLAVVDTAGTQINISNGILSQTSAPLSPEVQKLIQDVFSLKFSDNSNTRSLDNHTDTLIPQSLVPIKLASGVTAFPLFLSLSSSTSGALSTTQNGPGIPGNIHIDQPPTIALSGDAAVTVHTGASQATGFDTVSGTVSFTDINAGDLPTVSTKFVSFKLFDAQHNDITATLTSQQQAQIAAVEAQPVVTPSPGNNNNGSATWTYSVADTAFNFLTAGETLALTYNAIVDNNFPPQDLTASAPFTITISGPSNVEWIHPTSGLWSVGSNWSTGSVPTASDDAIIPAQNIPGGTGLYNVTIEAPAFARNLTLNANDTTGAQVTNDSTLTVGQMLTIFNNGVLNNSGTVTVGKLELFDQSLLQNSGLITLGQGGDFTESLTITNSGTIVLAGGTLNVLTDIDNSGGTIDVDSGTMLNLKGVAITGGTINGFLGAINVTADSSIKGSETDAVLNNGGVTVESGVTLTLDNVSANSTTFADLPGSVIQVDAGTSLTLNGSVIAGGTIDDLGTIIVTADSAINGTDANAVLNNGVVGVESEVTLTLDNVAVNTTTFNDLAGGSLRVDEGDTLSLNGAIVNGGAIADNGTITINGAVTFEGGVAVNGGAMSIAKTATLDIENPVTGIGASLNGVNVINSGTIQVDSDGPGTTTISLLLDAGTQITGGTLLIHVGFPINTIEGAVEIGKGGAIFNQLTVANNNLLTVDSGDTLTFNSATIDGGTLNVLGELDSTGTSFITAAAIVNAGNIVVSSGTLTIDPTPVTNTGTIEVTGDSSLVLSQEIITNTGGKIEVDGIDPTDFSTLNLDGTAINGGAVVVSGLLVSTGLSSINGAAIASTGPIDVTSGILTVDAAISFDNGGTLEADGAELDLISTIVTNTGTVEATGTNGTLDLKNAAINGGSILTANSTDVIEATSGVSTISGTSSFINNGTVETLGAELDLVNANVVNNGFIIVDVAEGSSGTLNLQGASISGGSVSTAASTDVIEASGGVSTIVGATSFVNDGTVEANGAELDLVDTTVTNNGTVEAAGTGGVLNLKNVTIDGGAVATANSTDVIEATNGVSTINGAASFVNNGTVETLGAELDLVNTALINNGALVVDLAGGSSGTLKLQNASINGGSVSTAAATDLIEATDGVSTIGGTDSFINNGTLEALGAELDLVGTAVTNNGTIESIGTGVLNLRNVTINGGTLGGSGRIATAAGNVESTLSGVTIAASTLVMAVIGALDLSGAITNNGEVDAATGKVDLENVHLSGGTLGGSGTIATADANIDSTLDGVTVAVGSTVTAAVGTLDLTGIIANHGQIDATTGKIDFENATLNGGTLGGGGIIATVSGANVLSGVTIAAGTTVQVTDNTSLELVGTIENSGTIALNSSGDVTELKISGNVVLDGGGQVTLSDSADNSIVSDGSAATLTNFDTIAGAGTIGDDDLTLVNSGTIDANGTEALIIDTGINTMTTAGLVGSILVTNDAGGLLEASAGHTLQIDDNVLNNGLIQAGETGSFSTAVLNITGSVTGTGSIDLFNNAMLQIGGSVSSGQTASFGVSGGPLVTTGMLILDDSRDFHATISGLTTGDSIALADIAFASNESAVWTQTTAANGGSGTLQIFDGSGTLETTLNLTGIYTQNQFALTEDAASHGTDVHINYVSFAGGTINVDGVYTPQITNAGSTIELTNSLNYEASSWFDNAVYSISEFTASFDYVATAGSNPADGMAFILQNSSAGVHALGGHGRSLGYGGPDFNQSADSVTAISPSAAIELNLYAPYGQGTAFATDGGTGNYGPTGNVAFASGDQIQAVISYNGSVLGETLTDLVTGATFSASYTVDLASVLGGDTAHVGFSAATGASVSTQIISNFAFAAPAASSTIVASAPNQTLSGFAVADTFVFNFANVGQTTVTDFHPATDILEFGSPIFANALAVLNATHDDGHGNAVIAVDAHDSITLNGVLKAQLHATDFHVV